MIIIMYGKRNRGKMYDDQRPVNQSVPEGKAEWRQFGRVVKGIRTSRPPVQIELLTARSETNNNRVGERHE